MKKDNQLESAFNQYFESSKAPDESVLNAAKNSMERPATVKTNTVLRRILVSAACALSALVSGAGLYFFPSTVGGIIAGIENGGNQAGSSPPSVSVIEYYGAEGLDQRQVDIYADGAPSGLDFVKKLNCATNFSVNSVDGYSSDGGLAYVRADFSAVVNGSRHDTVIYAEYTQKYSVCELFREYYGGEESYYGGYSYLWFDTEENGEPVKKLTLECGGVKYYVAVAGSDQYAYRTWLDLIIK